MEFIIWFWEYIISLVFLHSFSFCFFLLLWLDNFKWAVFRFTDSLLDQVCCWSFLLNSLVIVFFRPRFPGFFLLLWFLFSYWIHSFVICLVFLIFISYVFSQFTEFFSEDCFQFFVRQLIDLHFLGCSDWSFISFIWCFYIYLIPHDPSVLVWIYSPLRKWSLFQHLLDYLSWERRLPISSGWAAGSSLRQGVLTFRVSI